jgi:hypothetical protein
MQEVCYFACVLFKWQGNYSKKKHLECRGIELHDGFTVWKARMNCWHLWIEARWPLVRTAGHLKLLGKLLIKVRGYFTEGCTQHGFVHKKYKINVVFLTFSTLNNSL